MARRIPSELRQADAPVRSREVEQRSARADGPFQVVLADCALHLNIEIGGNGAVRRMGPHARTDGLRHAHRDPSVAGRSVYVVLVGSIETQIDTAIRGFELHGLAWFCFSQMYID